MVFLVIGLINLMVGLSLLNSNNTDNVGYMLAIANFIMFGVMMTFTLSELVQ